MLQMSVVIPLLREAIATWPITSAIAAAKIAEGFAFASLEVHFKVGKETS